MTARIRKALVVAMVVGLLAVPGPGHSRVQEAPSFMAFVTGSNLIDPLDPLVHERHEGAFAIASGIFEARRGTRTVGCTVQPDDPVAYRARETAVAGRGFILTGVTARGSGRLVADTDLAFVGEAVDCEVRLGHPPTHDIEG